MREIDRQFLRAILYSFDNEPIEELKAMIDKGANINCQVEAEIANDKMAVGMTALMMAINEWKMDVVTFLMESGADIDMKDAFGNAALHHAAICGAAASILVDMVLANKPNIDSKNNDGDTALHRAIKMDSGEFETVERLLRGGADVLVKNEVGLTPCDLAINSSDVINNPVIVELIKARQDEIMLDTLINQSVRQPQSMEF